MPTLLDADLLQRFETALRASGVEAVDALMPGLTDAKIDEVAGPSGLQLPEEVRAWWRWRNGSPPRVYSPLFPPHEMLPLEVTVATYQELVNPEYGFFGDPEHSLHLLSEFPVVSVQCVGVGDVPAPVYTLGEPAGDAELTHPSLGQLVLSWIDEIER